MSLCNCFGTRLLLLDFAAGPLALAAGPLALAAGPLALAAGALLSLATGTLLGLAVGLLVLAGRLATESPAEGSMPAFLAAAAFRPLPFGLPDWAAGATGAGVTGAVDAVGPETTADADATASTALVDAAEPGA